MSLRARILLLVLLAALLPAVVVIGFLIEYREQDVSDAKRDLAALARKAGEDLNAKIQGTRQLLFGLSHSRALDTEDREACSAYLAEVLKQFPQYTGILTIKPDGELHCDSLRTGRKLNLTDRAYFRRALASAGPALEPVFGRLTGIAVLQVALAARNARGEARFVLLASLDLDKFARETAAAQPYPSTLVTLWDAGGTLMSAHPVAGGKALAGKKFPDSELFRFARSGRAGDTGEFAGLLGVDRVWGLGTLPQSTEAGLTLVLGVPSTDLRANAERRMRTALAGIAGAVLLALAAAWVLAERGVRRPVGRIMAAVARFSGGDRGARIGAPYPGGEMGKLMRALDRTVDEIERQRIEIEAQAAALERVNRALTLINTIRQALLSAGTEEKLLDEVCRIAVEVGGYPMARIGYAEHDAAQSVRTVALRGPAEALPLRDVVSWADIPAGRGPTGTAIRTGKTAVLRDLRDAPDYAPWQGLVRTLGYDCAAGFPLVLDGEAFGALSLFSTRRDAFGDDEIRLLDGMAADLSLGVAALRAKDIAHRTLVMEESNRFKSEFIARMSHELRTPLNAVQGFAELIEEAGEDNARMRSHARDIHAAGERLRLLVEDILALAEIESGRAAFVMEPVAPKQLVEAALRGAAPLAALAGVTLAADAPDGLPEILADARRVRLALRHLLSNAVKHSTKGGTVALSVRLARGQGGAPMVEFAVEDHGEGIAAQDLPKLFQPFVQLDPVLTRRHGGTGLGLALVKRVAEVHGGEVSVQSEPGKGSLFTLRLPVDRKEAIA